VKTSKRLYRETSGVVQKNFLSEIQERGLKTQFCFFEFSPGAIAKIKPDPFESSPQIRGSINTVFATASVSWVLLR
jgi:hypothetical protein